MKQEDIRKGMITIFGALKETDMRSGFLAIIGDSAKLRFNDPREFVGCRCSEMLRLLSMPLR